MHHPVVIPHLTAVVRHALPNIIEGKVIPILLFVGCLRFLGTGWALTVALVWSLVTIGLRLAMGRRVSGLLVLSAAALTARTVAAVASGSLVVYFAQPIATTVLVGLTFLVSVAMGSPLAERLACDVLPFEDKTLSHPLVRQFFVRLSVLWFMTSMVNAGITLWLLLTQSTTTFVLVKSILGPATGIVTVGTMFIWFRFNLARTGTPLVWSRPARPAVA
ncbi:MAG: hypothetical protein GY929_09775 [Actinomycetia bacterium]|nr:hypothetical protein [Actinomycetes bacterium]